MKPLLLSAFFLSVSTLACGKGTEPITAPPAARPTAVSIMSASVNDRSVTLTFTPTSSAAAASVQYHVTCQSGVGNYTATGKASPITIAGLTNGTQIGRASCRERVRISGGGVGLNKKRSKKDTTWDD